MTEFNNKSVNTNNSTTSNTATSTNKAVTSGIRGELTFEDKVVQKIIGIALSDVPGLLGVSGGFFSNFTEKLVNTDNKTSGIGVEVGKEQVAVDLDIIAEYGKNVSEIYTKIKDIVTSEVAKMTDLDVVEVNANVVDVKTRAQYEKEQVTVQDKLSDAAESTGNFVSETSDKASRSFDRQQAKLEEKAEPRVK